VDRKKLQQAVINAIATGDSHGAADPERYDIDAIVDELIGTAPDGPVQEFDPSDYWATIAKHRKKA